MRAISAQPLSSHCRSTKLLISLRLFSSTSFRNNHFGRLNSTPRILHSRGSLTQGLLGCARPRDTRADAARLASGLYRLPFLIALTQIYKRTKRRSNQNPDAPFSETHILHFCDVTIGASKSEGSTLGNTFARAEKTVRVTSELNIRNKQQCLAYLGSQ